MKGQLPLLSIIIPTFNRRQYLADAIQSALEQSWPRTEVIVVDDGSTDETPAYLKSLAARYPEERFRYACQANQGPSAARNRGLAMARGTYVKFLDSDDSIETNACAEYIASLERYGADLCIGSRRYMSPEGRKWSINYVPPAGIVTDPLTAFFNLDLKPQGALWCYKRSLFNDLAWDATLLAREDTDLLVRLLVKGFLVCGAPEAAYNQRYHQIGRQMDLQFEPTVLQSIVSSNERHLLLMQAHRVSWRARRAFARSMSRSALRLWSIDRAAAHRLSRLARRAFPLPELVVTKSYPLSAGLRIIVFVLWFVGGVRLCGPLWALRSKRLAT
jgi:cellulose synthase/poly-beta-1,6-N-acetylglucosamine synthase-like glycosyltransferase